MQPREVVNYLYPINWNHSLNRGLVSWWLPLPNRAGGLYLRDLTRKNDGTLTNGPTWVPGRNGFGAVKFDGTNDYVDCGDPASLNLATMSLEAYFYPTTTSNYPAIVAKADAGSTTRNFDFDLDQVTGSLRFYFTSGGAAQYKGFSANTSVTLNTWHHAIATFDGSTQRIYLDGKADGSNSAAFTPDTSGQGVAIGRMGASGSAFFQGNIALVRIYNRALSASEVAALYQETLRGYPNTLNWLPKATYYLPQTSPVTTEKLIGGVKQPKRFVNYLNPINWNHSLNQGLVSWWLPLPGRAGGSTLRDLCRWGKNANDGTLTNGPTWTAGRNGFGALNFNGSNDYVVMPSPSLTATTNVTLAIWIKYISLDTDGDIPIYNGDAATNGYGLYKVAGGNLDLLLGGVAVAGIGGSISAGEWMLLTLTRTGTTWQIWKNGVTLGGTSTSNPGTPTTYFVLGDYLGREAFTLPRIIGSAWAYNRALSATEILDLYQETLRGYPNTLNWLPKTSFPSISAAPPGPALSFNAAWAIQSSLFIGAGSFR